MSREKSIQTLNEAEVEVVYDFQPEEPAETGPEAQYPGCPMKIEIEFIYLGGVDIMPALCSNCVLELENSLTDLHKD